MAMAHYERIIYFTVFLCASEIAYAQSGPGQLPNPWNFGPSLSVHYDNGGITLNNPVGGTLGPGTINAAGGYYINGVAIPGTLGSQAANLLYASPNGVPGTPTFRPIANGDLPSSIALTGIFSVLGPSTLTGPVTLGSSLSVPGTLSGAGVANYLAQPPCIGCVIPNGGAFTSLSAFGSFTLSANTKYSQPAFNTRGTVLFSPIVDVIAAGAAGDGSTDDTSAIQAAVTAATTSGGLVRFPCGTYKVTHTITASIASNSSLSFSGAGASCTTINATGAIGTLFSIAYGNNNSTFRAEKITHTSDQAGTVTAYNLTQTTHTTQTLNTSNDFYDLNFVGSDTYSGADTKYFAFAMKLNNISNINIINVSYDGGAVGQGNGIYVTGLAASTYYSIVQNFVDYTATNCADAIEYGDWVQGMQITNSNFTGCTTGVNVLPGATGNLAQLAISNSQFGYNITDINMQSPIANVLLSNNLFLIQTGGHGVIAATSYSAVTGNTFLSSTGGQVGYALHWTDTGGGTHGNNNGIIIGNNFFNLTSGILIDSGASVIFMPNAFSNVTTPWTNNSTASSTTALGVNDASVAPAGDVGEHIKSNIPIGSAVGLTTNFAKNVTSVNLTPGDYECGGDIAFNPAVTTTQANVGGGISTVANALPTFGTGGSFEFPAAMPTGAPSSWPVGLTEINVSVVTPVYLVAFSVFAASTQGAYGNIDCVRQR